MILHNVHLVECLMAIFEVFQVTASNHWQIRIKECWPETVLWELKKFFTNFLPKKLCKIAKFCLFRSWSSKTMRRNSLKDTSILEPILTENVHLIVFSVFISSSIFQNFFLQDFALAVEQITTKILPERCFVSISWVETLQRLDIHLGSDWGSEPISSSTWMGALQSAAQTDVCSYKLTNVDVDPLCSFFRCVDAFVADTKRESCHSCELHEACFTDMLRSCGAFSREEAGCQRNPCIVPSSML